MKQFARKASVFCSDTYDEDFIDVIGSSLDLVPQTIFKP